MKRSTTINFLQGPIQVFNINWNRPTLSLFRWLFNKYLRLILHQAKWPIRPELIPVSVAWSDYEYFYSLLDGIPIHCRVTHSIKFAATHLYTWVEKGTVRVKSLAKGHNTMSPARARTRTTRSGDERSNHEATAPHGARFWDHEATAPPITVGKIFRWASIR